MTQTKQHIFHPFSSSNFFSFDIYLKKNCTHTLRNIASLSIRLVSTCFSMSNYARWDKKRDIHDASLLVMPIFEAKRRKNKREIGTIANQGWWTQPKKPPIKKNTITKHGRSKKSRSKKAGRIRPNFEKCRFERGHPTLKKVLFQITLYISSCVIQIKVTKKIAT